VELAGALAPGAREGARGFVGMAFRLQEDRKTYDAFYLRPTNGRAEDQERRNHSAQYVSYPGLLEVVRQPRVGLTNRPDPYPALGPVMPPGSAAKLLDEERGER
jgi:hypothetical protein